jgi:uncharacterized protein
LNRAAVKYVLVGAVLLLGLVLLAGDCVVVKLSERGWRWPVLFAVRLGVSPNAVCNDTSLLDAAILSPDTELVRLLLSRGADVNRRSRGQFTPLMAAAAMGRQDMVRVLLTAGADVNARASGQSLLLAPIHNGHVGTIRQLIAAGADVRRDSAPLLIEAIRVNNLDLVEALLEGGATPNARAGRGDTALMWAAAVADIGIIRLLLAHGADASMRDNDGRTAVEWAAKERRQNIVHILGAIRRDSGRSFP